jgi:hypothetical protein
MPEGWTIQCCNVRFIEPTKDMAEMLWNTRADTSSDAAAMACRWLKAKETLATKDAEIARLTQENERMRRENADLLGSLRDLYNLISDSNAPTFIADADYGKITNAAVLISLATPIPDPAGGMPVEVECVRCSEPTVESDFNGYCPVCHDDMGAGDA